MSEKRYFNLKQEDEFEDSEQPDEEEVWQVYAKQLGQKDKRYKRRLRKMKDRDKYHDDQD